MQKIYTTENRVFVYLLKSKLAANGIDCIIKNEEVSGPAAGEIPPVVAKPELWVIDDEQYSLATHIIKEELAAFSLPKKEWHCPQCGEYLEGQFDVCWKCGHSKAD